MGKYVFQQGGDPSGSDVFNSYVDTIIASQHEDSNYVQPAQAAEEVDSDYIKQLRDYDDEQSKQTNEGYFNQKLQEFSSALDDKIAQLQDKQEEFDWFASSDGNDFLGSVYDTQTPANQGSVPYSKFAGEMQPQNNVLNKTVALNFRSSGESGTQNIGPYGVQIGNEVAGMLGYQPTYNSIYRTKANNDALIRAGKPAVKNSHHLKGNAIDIKPADWNKLSSTQKAQLKSKYDVIFHNNHYHVEPK